MKCKSCGRVSPRPNARQVTEEMLSRRSRRISLPVPVPVPVRAATQTAEAHY
jgi:hypothetical protein